MALLPTTVTPPPQASYQPIITAGNGEKEADNVVQQTPMQVDGSSDPYVSFTASTVPNQSSVANGSLPFGFFFSPVSKSDQNPPILRRDIVRCTKCGAYVNPYCKVDKGSGQWNCIFCTQTNNTGSREYSTEEFKSALELMEAVVDWQPLSGISDHNFALPGDSSAGDLTAPPVLYAIDESLDEDELAEVAEAVLAGVQALPSNTLVGVLTYGASVAVYDISLSGNGVATAEVLSGAHPPTPASLRPLLYGTGAFLAPVHAALAPLKALLSALRPNQPRLPRALRARCMGPALEVAIGLLKGAQAAAAPNQVAGRVLVCAGGHPSQGPGGFPSDEEHPQQGALMSEAAQYLHTLGARACQAGVFIDVLAGSRQPVGAHILEPMVREAGGCLVLHEGFGERFRRDLVGAPSRVHGWRGTIDMRASSGIALAQLVGPVAPLPPGSRRGGLLHVDEKGVHVGGVPASGGMVSQVGDLSVNAALLPTLEAGVCVAGQLNLTEELLEDHVYLQFALTFLPVAGTGNTAAVTTRVVTRRLKVAPTLPEYLQSVDVEAAALLAAKLSVLTVQKSEEVEGPKGRAQREKTAGVGPRLLDIARTFPMPSTQSKAHSMIRALPSELARVGELLYQLERGALIGDVLGHPDERRALHSRFLHANTQLATLILHPRLFVHREGGEFVEIPAVNLSMQSKDVLVLDHGTDVFIWIGLTIAEDESRSAQLHTEADAFIETLCRGRFPYPVIRSFREGSSMARYLSARLEPLHKEALAQQEARFPSLCMLPPQEREALQAKFRNNEELSFSEWMSKIPLRPSSNESYDLFMRKTSSVIQGSVAQAAVSSAVPPVQPVQPVAPPVYSIPPVQPVAPPVYSIPPVQPGPL